MSSSRIGRVVVDGPCPGSVKNAQDVLSLAFDISPLDTKSVDFLITPGGFIRSDLDIPHSGKTGWKSQHSDIDPFLRIAQRELSKTLSRSLISKAARKARFLTVGIDVWLNGSVSAELVAVYDLVKKSVIQWTGKSYPVNYQQNTLVHVTNLRSHLLNAGGERVLVLGCHDLNVFSPRGAAMRVVGSERDNRCRDLISLVDTFNPTIILQHPHTTDTPRIWTTAWSAAIKRYPLLKSWASGICYWNHGQPCRAELSEVLEKTASCPRPVDVVVSTESC